MAEPTIIQTPSEAQQNIDGALRPDASSQTQKEGKRDANGYPLSCTPEHIAWLKKLDNEYLKLPTERKNKDKGKWMKQKLDEFCITFSTSLIENSKEKTKDVSPISSRFVFNLT